MSRPKCSDLVGPRALMSIYMSITLKTGGPCRACFRELEAPGLAAPLGWLPEHANGRKKSCETGDFVIRVCSLARENGVQNRHLLVL